MLASCLVVFLVAALYEGLKVFREVLLRRSVTQARYGSVALHEQDNNGSTIPKQGFRTPPESVR